MTPEKINGKEFRYEKKFVISDLDAWEIEQVIRFHPAMFSEIFNERQVNNIYFDTIDMENCQNHLVGIAQRLKFRIRWYGELFGKIKEPILEIKIKNNEFGNKMLFNLNPFALDRNFSLNSLRKIFNNSGLPKWLVNELKSYFPVLINCYKRKYFVSENKKFRLTLDRNLQFFSVKLQENLFYEKIGDFSNRILELKFSLKDSEKADEITEHLPFRLTACSKCINGISLLDL